MLIIFPPPSLSFTLSFTSSWSCGKCDHYFEMVVLEVLTASFGVTGYSLAREQIGYWAGKIVTSVLEVILVLIY